MDESTDVFWNDAFIALGERTLQRHIDGDDDDLILSDDEDDVGANALQSRVHAGRIHIARLPDGDIHYCDQYCPYTEQGLDSMDRPTGELVCAYTGCVVHRVCEERTSSSTGRSIWSLNTDGASTQRSVCTYHKRDMKRASELAFRMGNTLVDSDMPSNASTSNYDSFPATPFQRRSYRRVASCVTDIVDDTATLCKSNPHSSRGTECRMEQRQHCVESLFSKLTSSTAAGASTRAPKSDKRTLLTTSMRRPDLMTHHKLFHAALQKYLKEVQQNNGVPSMDEINNIYLSVDNVIRGYTRQLKQREEATAARIVCDLQFRTLFSTFVVALFACISRTKYMQTLRRGADSFRPFCAGVCYALKRGLLLPTGDVLVPQIPGVAHALLTSRQTANSASIRALHASSHKGLCTLHRCIASVPTADLHQFFGPVMQMTKHMQNYCT